MEFRPRHNTSRATRASRMVSKRPSCNRIFCRKPTSRGTMALLFLLLIPSNALLLPAAVVHTVAGAIAASSGAIAAYPMDFVTSQLQTQDGREKYSDGWQAAVDIVKKGGPFALYRGVLVTLVGMAPEKTIKLSAYDMMRGSFQSSMGYVPLEGEILAASFAGMSQVIVTNPLEVVKTRLQTTKQAQLKVQDVLSQIESATELYQGAGVCMARDIVFSAILFPIYEHVKVALMAALVVGESAGMAAFWANMVAGSVAAAPAAFLSTPADVVKTRIQQAKDDNAPLDSGRMSFVSTSSLAPAIATEAQLSTSCWDVLSSIVAQEGPTVLFSGWLERVARSVPQFGVTLAVLDMLNQMAIQNGWVMTS